MQAGEDLQTWYDLEFTAYMKLLHERTIPWDALPGDVVTLTIDKCMKAPRLQILSQAAKGLAVHRGQHWASEVSVRLPSPCH